WPPSRVGWPWRRLPRPPGRAHITATKGTDITITKAAATTTDTATRRPETATFWTGSRPDKTTKDGQHEHRGHAPLAGYRLRQRLRRAVIGAGRPWPFLVIRAARLCNAELL